jgi:hypothetical protein
MHFSLTSGLVAAVVAFSLVAGESAEGADLVVTNATDLVNGDASNPAALAANPGPDGISLREALLAVNNSHVPATIVFDAALAGGTITLDQPLPPLMVDGTAIDGSAGGSSKISLDLLRIVGGNCAGLILAASWLGINNLRFTNVTPAARAVQIYAGTVGTPACSPTNTPQKLNNVVVADCEFDNSLSSDTAYALSVGTNPSSLDTLVRHVAILRNRFRHFQGDGTTVHLQVGGERNVLERVTIADNSFSDCMFAVELVNCCGGQHDDHIRDIFILRNRFERGGNVAVVAGTIGRDDSPLATGNSIQRIVIDRNTVLQQNHWAVILNGGFDNATENAIEHVTITNNVIANSATGGAGILLLGGDVGGVNNHVSHVRIANNTIAFNEGAGVVLADNPGGSGNYLAGVTILNSILWPNGIGLDQSLTPPDVENCVLANENLIGHNGNFAADPLFVDSAADDFHLKPGSPAIDAGTSDGAPCYDLEDRARFDDPATTNKGSGSLPHFDIGAYEFNGLPTHFASDIVRNLACDLMQIASTFPPKNPNAIPRPEGPR